MISLAWPWALTLLPLPILVGLLVPPHRERTPALRFPFFRKILSSAGVEGRSGSVILRRHRLQSWALIFIWLLVVTALARPERVGTPVSITRSTRDLVLAIDISGSMDAQDFTAPDGSRQQRLAAVRDVVRDFVRRREDDRVALIVFGSKAYVQSPLTRDLDTIVDLLDQTEVGMAGPHTALGDAIGLAIRTFDLSEVDDRLLILLSDGSDTASRMSPVNAAAIARGEGVEIITVGVGDPNARGEDQVDLQALQDIARRTGGDYFYAADGEALASIYDRIDELAPRKVETISHRPRLALAHVPLGLAAALGLLTLATLSLLGRRH